MPIVGLGAFEEKKEKRGKEIKPTNGQATEPEPGIRLQLPHVSGYQEPWEPMAEDPLALFAL